MYVHAKQILNELLMDFDVYSSKSRFMSSNILPVPRWHDYSFMNSSKTFKIFEQMYGIINLDFKSYLVPLLGDFIKIPSCVSAEDDTINYSRLLFSSMELC